MAYKVTIKGDPSAKKYRKFECECGNSWEDLLDQTVALQDCSECGVPVHYSWAVPAVAGYSIRDKSEQAEILKKRSSDHTKRMLKKDPEALGKGKNRK